ncbi:hypothetical protein [Gillisia sp. JM1]|uniref:capsular polysaccharide export protein, LipB/KpsS family n=1 Tax=Gillisia sp. JM1 TaxID=1283286 RepID=UPI0004299B28|nr:hypothetical protein [Gillisia sp. JM1]
MNILIFSTFHLPPLFIGLNLELIQRNIDLGNTVYLVDCNSSFSECGFNTTKLKYMCEICKYRENEGLKHIDGNIKRFSLNKIITVQDREVAKDFISEIVTIKKDLRYMDFEVGEAVFSSYISKTRNSELVSDTDQPILKKLTFNSILIYESIKRFIDEYNIDELALFNGRWDYYRAALTAAREKNLNIEVFENYRVGGYMELFGDNLPHGIKNKNDIIEEFWNSATDVVERQNLADSFFHNKRSGDFTISKSFTEKQLKGKLPASFDKNKRTFVLFNSSDDEFAAVGKEYDNPYFSDQTSGILFIVDYFKNKTDCQLIIRMHPNLQGLKRPYLDPLYNLKNLFDNIHLVKPEDDIDTYNLVDVAEKVLVFNSTIGLEASFWGKPVILLGKSLYVNNVVYIPKDKADILQLFESNLTPLHKDNARKYGYYFTKGGVKTKYYNNKKNGDIFFKNSSLTNLPIWFKVYYKTLKLFKVKN